MGEDRKLEERGIEDLIGPPDDTPPLTEAEEAVLWQRLFSMDLRGRHIEFSNRGGDMYRIDATLEKIFPILGGGILARVHSMTYANEREKGEPTPTPETFILLADWEPPSFAEDENLENRTIVLSGALDTILPDGMFVDYGTLDIGFIYP